SGFGYPTSFLLPATINAQRCFIQNDRFGWRFFGKQMAREPYPLKLATPKPTGTVRIFVYGESAAYGDPLPEFGLPRMLEAVLNGAFRGQRFEVINVAMTAINSHALLPIAKECASQEGDIWVIYMGNNEVVGPYGAGTVFGSKAPPLALVRSSLALKSTRTGQLLDRLVDGVSKVPASEKEWGGMRMFLQNQVQQDDLRLRRVYANFKSNLGDILSVAQAKGIKTVVCTLAANLCDCAPFASMHRKDLSAPDLAKWEEYFAKGIAAQPRNPAEAMAHYREAE